MEAKTDPIPPEQKPASAPATNLEAATANVVMERNLTPEDICFQCCDWDGNIHYYRYRLELNEWVLETNSSKFRDVWWAKWTMPYGWPVQGIWSDEYDGAEVLTVARSHTYKDVPVVVSADNFGRIRLFNYPV